MGLLWQERLLGGESAGSSHPVGEAVPGRQSLVHISARNRAERENAAWVFPVPGSQIRDYFNLAKGQLVLHPVPRPFRLPATFCYLSSYIWRITAFAREDAAWKARGKGVGRKLTTEHGWTLTGVEQGGGSVRWVVLAGFPARQWTSFWKNNFTRSIFTLKKLQPTQQSNR